jgi:putative heme iron utilization protein
MEAVDRDRLGRLLATQRVLALSVIVDQAPYVGQLPFALQDDWSALLINVSRLARHARGLSDGARFAALVQQAGAEEIDPFQRPRVTFEGEVHRVAPTDASYQACRETYLGNLPSGEITFGLGDFTLYRLDIERGRFVAGFGAAYTVTPKILAEIAAESET